MEKPRGLAAAFATNIAIFVVAILLIQLDPLQSQANRGYFDSPTSELGPDPHPFLPIPTIDEAIDIANGMLPSIMGEAFVPLNKETEYFWGELIWDHEAGNIYYWELSQDDVSMSIDATTGDVVDFSWYRMGENGNLTREQALAVAMKYIEFFGGLPSDASPPTIEYIHRGATYSWNEETGERTCTDVYDWWIETVRVKDGVPTDDHIWVVLDPNGGSARFYKVWNMDLRAVATRQRVSYSEALGIARSVSVGTNITSIENRIVRPIGGWNGEPWKYGTDPTCVWRVGIEYSNLTYLAMIQIDARTGRIVGADWYR